MANPGSAFWESAYGISSYEEFKEKAGPYLPDIHWLGIGPSEETIALLAWNDPLSAPGNVASIALSIQHLAGVDDGGRHSVIRNVAPRVQLEQENTVAQLIIPNCFQVAIEGTSGGQDVTNVVGVQNPGGTALGAAQAVQAAWKGAGHPMAVLSSLYTLKQFRSMDIGSANGAIATIADTTAGSVTSTNALATNGACALIKWNGSTRSKSSRGRMYFGPQMEVNINPDGRTLTGPSLSSLQTVFDGFRNSLSTAGYPLVVLSRQLSQAFTVSSCTPETVIATQRRRIRG